MDAAAKLCRVRAVVTFARPTFILGLGNNVAPAKARGSRLSRTRKGAGTGALPFEASTDDADRLRAANRIAN